MSPENNQPATGPTQPEEVITGMPAELQSAPAAPEEMLEAGEQEPLLEAGEQPKVIDASDMPPSEPSAPEVTETPIPEQPSAPMQEFGGYTNITSPTPEQAEEKLRQAREAAGPSAETEGDVNPVRPYVQQ